MGILERHVDVLFHKQYGNTVLLINIFDNAEYFFCQKWGQSQRWFIEHEQLRTAHQGTSDCQHLLFTATHQSRLLVTSLLQNGKMIENIFQIALYALFVVPCVSADVDIF